MMNITRFIGLYVVTGIILLYMIPKALLIVLSFIVRLKKSTDAVKRMNAELGDNTLNEASGGILSDREQDNIKTMIKNLSDADFILWQVISVLVWPFIIFPVWIGLFKTGYRALTDEPDGSN